MYCPHFLQAVEMAARGSDCWCPQRGQLTRTLACFFAGIQCSPARTTAAGQRPPNLAGSGILGASLDRDGGAVGETLLGLTSVLPTNVTPSSMASLAARMSPNNSVLALMSILSLAVMLPLTLPRATTLAALMLPLTTAPSPRFKVPSVWISPSSFPSKVSSPENLMFPLISTSEFNTFFDAVPVVFIFYLRGLGYDIRVVVTPTWTRRQNVCSKIASRNCRYFHAWKFCFQAARWRSICWPFPVTLNESHTKSAPARVASLDAYRGLVMVLMMADVLRLCRGAAALPESGFWKFLCHHQSHVEWIGCSLHDLIQPSFSFLVGVALPFSRANRLSQGQARGRM